MNQEIKMDPGKIIIGLYDIISTLQSKTSDIALHQIIDNKAQSAPVTSGLNPLDFSVTMGQEVDISTILTLLFYKD